MFPSKFPLALLIHTALICLTVLGALYLTSNPLALAGLLLVRPIETYPLGNVNEDEDLDDDGADDDHQNREAGFAAKHS